MLLSVVAWDDAQRSACETKIRTSIYLMGHMTHEVPGRINILPKNVFERAVEAVRWTLNNRDTTPIKEGFGFTSLMPAYALADAAESFGIKPKRKGDKVGNTRLVMLGSLWDQVRLLDLTVVVRSNTDDETLVDAVKDLSRKHIIVTPADVWSRDFGDSLAKTIVVIDETTKSRRRSTKKVPE